MGSPHMEPDHTPADTTPPAATPPAPDHTAPALTAPDHTASTPTASTPVAPALAAPAPVAAAPTTPPFSITIDGAYAARLARSGDAWFPERWTLDGPEPYAVPLPGNQPEEPGTQVQPMADGRVLIHRLVEHRHTFSLLYPTGPGTGELLLGAVECVEPDSRLTLLPPAPGGARAYALAVGTRSTVVWLVAGGAFAPERIAEVPGRCSGGVWLDRTGRMLALDREMDGRTKAVVVDLERAGEVSPLLQIAEGSDDRLLLADPDSGLLLISSDAPSPGRERLGWGVLGSTLPVRFPECLRVPDCVVTPFAIQPGQVLMPENCGVALRIDGPYGTWVGVWRPADRQIQHLRAPDGWPVGTGLWTADGALRVPYATDQVPCGVAQMTAGREQDPATADAGAGAGTDPADTGTNASSDSGTDSGTGTGTGMGMGTGTDAGARAEEAQAAAEVAPEPSPTPTTPGAPEPPEASEPFVPRPVPLQQAPLAAPSAAPFGAPLGGLVTKWHRSV
uniref:hypothetical protein n=1 Tax=Streptomyces corallincola TaxID=2851888 RepID=UPI001FE455EE|nr:hypothetical protein [Streptomyces corallincola]